MQPQPSRLAVLALGASLCFCGVERARATADASSQLSFGSLSISPGAGTLQYLTNWQGAAFAQAGPNSQYNSGPSSSAGAAGDYSLAGGQGLTLSMSGQGNASADVPGQIVASDDAAGRGSINTAFEITGGTGTVEVSFSASLSGSLSVLTDNYGQSAQAEATFSLEVNGNSELFYDQLFSIGSDASQSQTISQTLANTVELQYGMPYQLWLEADAEAMVSNVPEPGAGALVLVGLGFIGMAARRVRRPAASRGRAWFWLAAGLSCGLGGAAQAMYVGSDAPDICQTCGVTPNRQPGGALSTSLTEGNQQETYPVVTVRSGSGPTLDLSLIYNSYNADGSKAQVDTGLGFGWTHSYNVLLFQQRGHLFRLGADGRVTQYFQNYSGSGGTYTSDTGYFETVTTQPDGSFILTNKNQSWWHFALVPNTPFLVAGPVYRLIQMGDRNQNTNTLSYGSGLLTSITDTYGRTITFAYDSSNKLAGITDPLGRTTQFQYDPRYRMPVSITDPAGRTVHYTYNSLYQLTRKIDRDGRTYLYLFENELPYAVVDGLGQSYFSLANPSQWAVDRTNLALTLRRQYTPSTTSRTDGRGNLWQYQYDTNGYLTQVTAPDSSTTAYSYDPGTLEVNSVTDPDGNVTTYQYDGQGNRIALTDALGFTTTYTYEPVFNQMTSMTDPRGRVTTYQYDGRGNRTNEIDPLLQTRSWTYDGHGNVLSATDKNGNVTTCQYDAFGDRTNMTDALGNTTSYTYDGVGNRLSTSDPLGRTTRYQYDPLYRVIGVTNALGGVTSYTYDGLGRQISRTDPNTNTTTYAYDQRGRLTQMTDALGGSTTYGYDPNDNRLASTNQLGQATTCQYDLLNRVIDATNAIGGITRYTYDPVGNRLSSTDPNGHTTTYQYDALNRRIGTIDALGGVTSYGYATLAGPPCCSATPGSSLLTSQQDPDGNLTFYHYDELDRRTQVVGKNSDTNDVINPGDAVTTYTYDPNNNRLSMTDPATNTTTYLYDAINRQTNMADAMGDTTRTVYDADSNVIAVTAPNGNTTTNVYDALNRVIATSDQLGPVRTTSYDPVGNVLSTTDPLGHTTTYTYDGLNRRITTTDALLKTTTTVYDAVDDVITNTDRNGHVTTYTYDGLDRRVMATDPLGNTTRTLYDGVGNITNRTDANGHPTSYTYDAINRRISTTDPLGRTTTYAYDPVGNLTNRTDAAGRVTTYSYNDLYYLTNRAYQPSGTNDNFIYDPAGRMLEADRSGWTNRFQYDGANRLTNTVQNGRPILYAYDIVGRTVAMTYPSGGIITNYLDGRDRLNSLNDGAPLITYTYDGANRVVTRSARNNTTASYMYDADNRVLSLQHTNVSGLIAGFGYAYDNEGNKLYEQKLDSLTNSQAYVYDAADRLTSFSDGTLSGMTIPSPSEQELWTLDPLGNWNLVVSNSVTQSRTHDAANELTSINSSNHLNYDAVGNLIQDTLYLYSYDEENRLMDVVRQSDSATVGQYFYDALGRRISKIADPAGATTTNVYFYDGVRIIEEQNSGGATLATYTYGNYVDEVLTMTRGGQTNYYHQNALWSPHALTDSSGNVVERYTYDAYGLVGVMDASYHALPLNGWGTPHSAASNEWIFTGRQVDEEAGLYFYRARCYDDIKGRFLERDSAGYVDGMNLYEYVGSSPTTSTDPSGLEKKKAKEVYVVCSCSFTCCDGSKASASANVDLALGTVTAGTILKGGAKFNNFEGLKLVGNILQVVFAGAAGDLSGLLTTRAGEACSGAIDNLNFGFWDTGCKYAAQVTKGNTFGGWEREGLGQSRGYVLGATYWRPFAPNRTVKGSCNAYVRVITVDQ